VKSAKQLGNIGAAKIGGRKHMSSPNLLGMFAAHPQKGPRHHLAQCAENIKRKPFGGILPGNLK